jgi:transposase InsO family protein
VSKGIRHQTLQTDFLNEAGPFASIKEAQAAVDGWRHEYNHDRPHQSLDMATPASWFRPSPPEAGMSKARLVITAVVADGRSQSEVARAYGVSQGWVSRLVARYRAEGEAGSRPGRGGRAPRLRRSLAAQSPQPATLAQLQALLDTFAACYNRQRPHRSLPHQATPATAYHARPKTTPGNRKHRHPPPGPHRPPGRQRHRH